MYWKIDVYEYYKNKMEFYKFELKDLCNEFYKNGKEFYRFVFKIVRYYVYEVILF